MTLKYLALAPPATANAAAQAAVAITPQVTVARSREEPQQRHLGHGPGQQHPPTRAQRDRGQGVQDHDGRDQQADRVQPTELATEPVVPLIHGPRP